MFSFEGGIVRHNFLLSINYGNERVRPQIFTGSSDAVEVKKKLK